LFFKSGYLEFAVIYKPDRVFAHHHFGFHALSEGFYNFTSTGYKSIFAVSNGGVADSNCRHCFTPQLYVR